MSSGRSLSNRFWRKGNYERRAISPSVTVLTNQSTFNLLITLFLFKIAWPFFTGANPFIRVVLPLLGSWEIHSFKSSSNVTSSAKASLIAILLLSFPLLPLWPQSMLHKPDIAHSGYRILAYIRLRLYSTAISYLCLCPGSEHGAWQTRTHIRNIPWTNTLTRMSTIK